MPDRLIMSYHLPPPPPPPHILTHTHTLTHPRNDAKTVNVISTACFSPISRIVVSSLKFFLTGESEEESDNESSDSEVCVCVCVCVC